MKMEKKNNFFKQIALRIKLHVVNCCKHDQDVKSANRHITAQIGSYVNMDYMPETQKSIYTSLQTSKYIPYSCLIIYINCVYCDCNHTLMHEVVSAMKQNIYLRYKSKVLLTTHYLRYLERGSTINFFFYKNEYLDNTIVFEYTLDQDKPDERSFAFMHIDSHQFKTVEECYVESNPESGSTYYLGRLLNGTTTADLYFYNINPALAIIVNNYYFSTRTTREGSEYDVMKLILELNATGVPFILVENLTTEELLEVLSYLEKENLSPVKSFLFFMMSHGHQNNVIYTYDGQLNIRDDIIKRILLNESMKNATKLFVFTACRGSINTCYTTAPIIEKVNEMQPTESSHLDENSIVLYSVPELIQSPRKRNGTPFMQNFLTHFEKMIFLQVDIKELHSELEQSLKKIGYFRRLKICSELVLSKPENSYKVIQMSSGSLEMNELFKKIATDFPTFKREPNGDDERKLAAIFCICGSVNKTSVTTKFSQLLSILNEDNCFIDE